MEGLDWEKDQLIDLTDVRADTRAKTRPDSQPCQNPA